MGGATRRKGLARTGLILLEIAGAAVAMLAAAALFVVWRLQSGPVSLAFFEAGAEAALERVLPEGHSAAIGTSALEKAVGGRAFILTLGDVEILDAEDGVVADITRIEAEFAMDDIASGRGPRRIVMTDPAFQVVRKADRNLKLEPPGGGGNLIRILTGSPGSKSAFRSAELKNAHILFKDESSGRSWSADGASASFKSGPKGVRAEMDGVFEIEGRPAALKLRAAHSTATGLINATLDVANAPVSDLLDVFYGGSAAVLSAPLTGTLAVTLTEKGAVVASRIDCRAGAGELRIGGVRAPVSSIEVRSGFDPADNSFNLERLAFDIDGSKGEIAGKISLAAGADRRAPREIVFDLKGGDVVVAAPTVFAAPLRSPNLAAKGAYRPAERTLDIDMARIEALDVVFEVDGSYGRSPKGVAASPALKANIRVAGALDPARIAAGWPLTAAKSVREFIATRLPTATVENLKATLDLPAGAIGPGRPMPDDALLLTFDVSGATALYSPGMTPLSEASGKGRLTGNRFVIENATGRVGKVAVSDGLIDFTVLSPKGKPVNFTFTAKGAARDILSVLNEEPLAVLKTTNLAPEQFSGPAEARVTITRPNLRVADRKAYAYSGGATFRNLTVSEFYRGLDLTKATGRIELAARSMTLKADAEIDGAPIQLEWRKRFYEADGASQFKVSGVLNSSTGDVLGVPTRQMLRGTVRFAAEANGDLGALDAMSVDADLAEAQVTLDAFGWRKPEGVAASGRIEASFDDAGTTLKSISFAGDGVAVQGEAHIAKGGGIQSVSFPRLFLRDAADVVFAARRNEAGALDATATGALLNISGIVKSAIEARPRDEKAANPWGSGLIVRGRIDEIVLRGGARYRDASLDLTRGPELLDSLQFSARTPEGKPVSVTLDRTGADEGPAQIVLARSDDIGALMAGVFGVTSIKGGEGSMRIMVQPKTETESRRLDGLFEARGLKLVEAPLFARIFAAASFDGLLSLLNGAGIDLAKARAEFTLKDGVLAIRDARATGPSVGITGEGEVATGAKGAVSLTGAVAPAYQVNSILGKAPIVGDLLVNRKGEGVMALSYSVKGASDAPLVSVNPLSALTPGVLRRMFEAREDVAPKDDAAESQP